MSLWVVRIWGQSVIVRRGQGAGRMLITIDGRLQRFPEEGVGRKCPLGDRELSG